jgi:SAM-dependent methyltransferase
VWDYVHDPALACEYDARLADCGLLTLDRQFAERHFDRPGRLLDLGCGTGRLLVPFARRGYWVVGVDLSAEMLKVARARAQSAGVEVGLLQANAVALGGLADESFDYTACLFSTLGMITGEENRRQALGHVHRLLRPGGTFVVHVHNRWFSLWDRAGRRWLVRDAVPWLRGGAGRGDRSMPTHQGIAGLALHQFTRREILRLLRAAGFRVLEVLPVGLGADGRLRCPWWLEPLRAYGYLVAARRSDF